MKKRNLLSYPGFFTLMVIMVLAVLPVRHLDNRQPSLVADMANLATLGGYEGLCNILDAIYPSHQPPAVSETPWSTYLYVTRQYRHSGRLVPARKYSRLTIRTLVEQQYNLPSGLSIEEALQLSFPYNDSLILCLKEAEETSREMAHYKEAIYYSKSALRQVNTALHSNDNSQKLLLEKVRLLNNIASIRLQQTKHNERTIKLINDAESVLNRCTGTLHPERGTLFHNKAMVEHYRKNYKAAIRLYLLAMSIRQQSLGELSDITAETYGDLGLLYAEIGNFRKGRPLVDKAIEIFSMKRGFNHPWTTWYCSQIGYLLLKSGQFEEAVPYLRHAKDGRASTLGENHKLTKEAQSMLEGSERWAKIKARYIKAKQLKDERAKQKKAMQKKAEKVPAEMKRI